MPTWTPAQWSQGFFLGGKAAGEVKMTTHLCLAGKLKGGHYTYKCNIETRS